MVNYKELVAKGVKWLDDNHSGWQSRIKPSLLNMNHYDNCVLGQMFNGYSQAEKILGEKFCIDHGFKYPNEDSFQDYHEYTNSIKSKVLDKEWQAVLEEAFDLSEVKVKPGLYEVVDNYGANITFQKGAKILVITIVSTIDISIPCYKKIINAVVSPSDYTLYVNCPIIVKRVKEST